VPQTAAEETSLKKNIAITALVVLGAVMPQARANQIIFFFTSPLGDVGNTHTYTDAGTGLTLNAAGYSCVGATGGLCANNPSTNYSADPTHLYDNSDGLGIANNVIGTHHEIPNSEFVQLDFSYIESHTNVSSIQFMMTDIVTAWSLYSSSTAGELKGTGTQLFNNSASAALQTISPVTSSLYSFIAGTNCDAVLNEVIINYTTITTQSTPEPATFLLSGMVLLGLAVGLRKRRQTA
jgi:hypothetical protein